MDRIVKKLILVIDDSEIIRSLIFGFLELQNFNVISAEDGSIGFHLVKELQPDLIISDIHMPNLDGYEVLKKVRENEATAKIPFIFLTSDTDPISRYQALQLGANDYLTKPFNISQLLEAIANQLKALHPA